MSEPFITDTGAKVPERRTVPVYPERDAGVAWELTEARKALQQGNGQGVIDMHIANALSMLKAPNALPEQRQPHDVLAEVAGTLIEILAELKHMRAALSANGSVPSIELSVDSKALVKPVVKIYDLDPEQASQEAQRIFDDLVIKYGPKAPA